MLYFVYNDFSYSCVLYGIFDTREQAESLVESLLPQFQKLIDEIKQRLLESEVLRETRGWGPHPYAGMTDLQILKEAYVHIKEIELNREYTGPYEAILLYCE